MDQHQKHQRRHTDAERHRQRRDGDGRVGQQVAHHRQQADDESGHHQSLGQRYVDAQQRQRDQQEDRSEDGVEQRDLDLREHDVVERVRQALAAQAEHGGQRADLVRRGGATERDDRAQHQPDEDVHEDASGLAAGQLQRAGVTVRQVHHAHAQVIDAVGQIVDQHRRQLLAGLFHQRHELLLPQQFGVAQFGTEEADGAEDQRDQQPHHHCAEQGNHHHARAVAGDAPPQQRRQRTHQLVHQQRGQQGRQQAQRDHGGQHVAGAPHRNRWFASG